MDTLQLLPQKHVSKRSQKIKKIKVTAMSHTVFISIFSLVLRTHNFKIKLYINPRRFNSTEASELRKNIPQEKK